MISDALSGSLMTTMIVSSPAIQPRTSPQSRLSRAAAAATSNGRIGVIGTRATIRSSAYKNEIEKINKDLLVFQKECPLFVPIVEEGFISTDDPIARLTVERYLEVLTTFAKSHFLESQCFIDENLNPFTGDWIARTLLKQRGDVIPDRGKDYNHSSFTDLIISDLVGVQVDEKGRVSVKSLIPEGLWDWYCLRDVSINDSLYTVVYDRDGSRYGLGKGLHVFSRPLR